MVRVNILNPKFLSDQHLVAEYLEIMMLAGYAKKHTELKDIPESYRLGKGHIKFFKNKFKYLKQRHEKIKDEMKKRGFKANKNLVIKLNKEYHEDWSAGKKDKEIIKRRLIEKINLKPEFYRYYGERKDKNFFIELIKKSY